MTKEFSAPIAGDPQGLAGEGDPVDEGLAQEQQEDVGKLKQDLEKAQAEAEEVRRQAEADLSRMRSSLDQRHAQDMGTVRSQLEESERRMHQAAMSNMDEQEKIAYQLEVERTKRQQAEADLAASRQAGESVRAMNQYAQGFMELGVKYENLDFTSPESLYASGWDGVSAVRKSLLERIDALENPPGQDPSQVTPTTPAGGQPPTAPPVMAQHGAQPSDTRSIGEVITALNAQYPETAWSEDKVVSYVERGLLPRSVIEGVDWNR
jgi:hypothetical protein